MALAENQLWALPVPGKLACVIADLQQEQVECFGLRQLFMRCFPKLEQPAAVDWDVSCICATSKLQL